MYQRKRFSNSVRIPGVHLHIAHARKYAPGATRSDANFVACCASQLQHNYCCVEFERNGRNEERTGETIKCLAALRFGRITAKLNGCSLLMSSKYCGISTGGCRRGTRSIHTGCVPAYLTFYSNGGMCSPQRFRLCVCSSQRQNTHTGRSTLSLFICSRSAIWPRARIPSRPLRTSPDVRSSDSLG